MNARVILLALMCRDRKHSAASHSSVDYYLHLPTDIIVLEYWKLWGRDKKRLTCQLHHARLGTRSREASFSSFVLHLVCVVLRALLVAHGTQAISCAGPLGTAASPSRCCRTPRSTTSSTRLCCCCRQRLFRRKLYPTPLSSLHMALTAQYLLH